MHRQLGYFVAWVVLFGCSVATAQDAAKPNILVIWGDDIGTWNISHNNRGMMGYSTPNIDRIAREGLSFTDYYGQQSCTAGRAAFIGGNVPVRTGMTKVGLPGAKEGWQKTDVTMATVMKSLGYATGQFGKNHQGDRDEHLPTANGFDEFVGNLYHLNAEEEPENEDYPGDMVMPNGKKFKVHLDGYDQSDLLAGKGAGKRKEIFYFDAGGNLNALRYTDWKIHFCLMEGDITQAYRKTPSWPIVVNLRQDPFERFAFESRMYLRWMADKLWTFLPAQQIVGQFLATFKEFPPSQKSDSLSVDQVLAKLSDQQSRN